MDFSLSKEHKLLQEMYRKFAENEVKPLAQEIDEEERFPRETVEKLAKYGFLGIPYSKDYEGQGADYLAYIMAVEELAKDTDRDNWLSAQEALEYGLVDKVIDKR